MNQRCCLAGPRKEAVDLFHVFGVARSFLDGAVLRWCGPNPVRSTTCSQARFVFGAVLLCVTDTAEKDTSESAKEPDESHSSKSDRPGEVDIGESASEMRRAGIWTVRINTVSSVKRFKCAKDPNRWTDTGKRSLPGVEVTSHSRRLSA